MKNNYLWFALGAAQCCVSAFIFGEVGGAFNLVAAVLGFVGYSAVTVNLIKRRRFQLLEGKSDKFLTKNVRPNSLDFSKPTKDSSEFWC